MAGRGIESRFVYPRDLTRDVARCLSDMRQRAWCDAQLSILDQTIDAIKSQFSDNGINDDVVEQFSLHASQYEGRAWALKPTTKPGGIEHER